MQHTINGQKWKVKPARLPDNQEGRCCYRTNTILLKRGMRRKNKRWTLIHEALHILLEDYTEEAVDRIAFDINELLEGEM